MNLKRNIVLLSLIPLSVVLMYVSSAHCTETLFDTFLKWSGMNSIVNSLGRPDSNTIPLLNPLVCRTHLNWPFYPAVVAMITALYILVTKNVPMPKNKILRYVLQLLLAIVIAELAFEFSVHVIPN